MDSNSTFPYNRIVQWAAGPVSSGVGIGTAWLSQKIGLVSSHQAAVQHDLTALGMVAVGAAVTYAAHHKWLTNVAHWFFAQEQGISPEGDDTTGSDVEGLDVDGTVPVPPSSS